MSGSINVRAALFFCPVAVGMTSAGNMVIVGIRYCSSCMALGIEGTVI